MILLDTNVLVYATDVRSPRHIASRRVVDAVIGGTIPGVIVTQVLVEYIAATTGPSMQSPLLPVDAVAQAETFRRQVRTFDAPPATLEYLAAILAGGGGAGRRTFDSYLAAQALALGISTICTYNGADFARIQGLSSITPDALISPSA